ncbi:uncharacterized protein ATNIH1004_000783 [Aspergillus tanneri]|uniref:Uncharacterized protein n=1 Tax=Aspergillus tanneri TaxID=1220188 RepID=A0A5M9MXS8_9EURO|nr:uncharacterized protein ATNIH1004_000783 [Aspergillus tanneri]KAA8651885.1 hypothetical protein ATNIH1004_000783 [Aspergillus tanneri]
MHLQRTHLDRAQSLRQQRNLPANITDNAGRTVRSWIASSGLMKLPTGRDRVQRFEQFLLDRGIDPNLTSGETPLHWAANIGDHAMVESLLQNDIVPPDAPDLRNRTPLSRAAAGGHCQIAKCLLATDKVDPDRKDGRGRTPLSWAAEHGHLTTVEVLIRYEANVDIHDDEGQTPLWWFITNGSKRRPESSPVDFPHWLKLLGPTNGSEPVPKTRRTPLSWACERGDLPLVGHLLQTTWADPNSVDRYRKTPLIYAMERNHHEIVELLISGRHEKRDIVSLRMMIQESRSRLLKPFLERFQPSLEREDDSSSVPLMRIALQQSDRATVLVLLEHKASIKGLDNGDWFGPCSTETLSNELQWTSTTPDQPWTSPKLPVRLANEPTAVGSSSIPVMRMAIQDGDRAVVTALLHQRARIMDLEEDEENFNQYNNNSKPSVAVDIMALRDGRHKVRWILDEELDEELRKLPKTSTEEIHLMLFRENYAWRTYHRMSHVPNELWFSLGSKGPCRTFTLSIQMNLKLEDDPSSVEGDDDDDDYTVRTIQWTVLEAPPKSICYFSNLPYGYIPQNDLELVQQFMRIFRKDWMAYCHAARRHLGQLRSHQLTARGKDDRLIDTVAEKMLIWTHIQGTLANQLNQARNFVMQYQHFSETRHFSDQMSHTIDTFDRDVSSQIEKLEQMFRDLLQIEFAWTTINEAHRSTSLATSMNRLSWITFIFLPLTFASSLFGMNVDILADNPTWLWYPLVGGSLLLMTVATWLAFKLNSVGGLRNGHSRLTGRWTGRQPWR